MAIGVARQVNESSQLRKTDGQWKATIKLVVFLYFYQIFIWVFEVQKNRTLFGDTLFNNGLLVKVVLVSDVIKQGQHYYVKCLKRITSGVCLCVSL